MISRQALGLCLLALLIAVHGQTNDPIPDTWDWREKGAIWPVADEDGTSNSFALVVAEAVSSYHFIQTGKTVKASYQELVDCCLSDYNWKYPRTGVEAQDIYSCIVTLDGLCWGADYPPVIGPEACLSSKCTPVMNITGGYWIQTLNETDLKNAVYKNPAVVMVNANQLSFQTYQSGVYADTTCDPKQQNHALLVVGYGTLDGKDVWYCKNSWGADWGDQGYIDILRNENICGIAASASIPV